MWSFPVINLVPILLLILLNTFVKIVVTSTPKDLTDPTGWSNSKYSIEETLVDPTGWNYDRKQKRYSENGAFANCDNLLKVKSENTQVKNNQEERTNNIVFVRRFISLLLESANLNNPNNVKNDVLHGLIEIKINVEQYQRLIQFSRSQENISFGELDSILSNTISGREVVDESIFGSVIDKMMYLASVTEIFLPLALVLFCLYLMWLTVMSKSLLHFLRSLLPVILLVAYIFEYYRRYKELEIEQMIMFSRHKDVPSSCSADQNVWGRIVSWFRSQDDCAEYHKAMLINPLYQVSPLGVLSCTLASFFTEPAYMVGTAIADFTKGILENLPFIYGWLVLVFTDIGLLVLVVTVIVVVCGGKIRFGNIFGGVSVSGSNVPLITSGVREALTNNASSSSEPFPQISSVNGSGKYILVEASTFKSLLGADQVAPANRIQELQRHIARSKSEPAELLESQSTKDSVLLPPNETDVPTGEMNTTAPNEDVVYAKEKQKRGLSKSQSYHESSSSRETTCDENDDVK